MKAPKGWRLVPIRPDAAMLSCPEVLRARDHYGFVNVESLWSNMLGHAPSAPAERAVSREEMDAWRTRHNLGCLSDADLKACFDDAATLHLEPQP